VSLSSAAATIAVELETLQAAA